MTLARSRLPCPLDVLELAATIAERGSPSEATNLALSTFGFASIGELADAHSAAILAALATLPAACDASSARLLTSTRRFLGSPLWGQCVAYGWPMLDVFGVAEWTPRERTDVRGLVPALAFSAKPGRTIAAIAETAATVRDADSRTITFRRPSLNADLADVVPWWESPALVNREAA